MNQYSSTLLEHLTTAIIVIEPPHYLAFHNPAAQALLLQFGMKPAKLADIFHPDFTGLLHQQIQSVSKSKTTITQRDTNFSLINGSTKHCDIVISPLESASFPPGSTMVEFISLDRYQRIAKESARLATQQAARFFLKSLAHEVKNPLGGMRGAAQLLTRCQDPKELQDFSDIIVKEADRLSSLVDRMLGQTKALERGFYNIHQVTQRVIAVLGAEFPNVRWQRDYDPSIPDFFFDHDQMIQAVMNICRNSCEALARAGTDQPTITLQTRIENKCTINHFMHPLVCNMHILDNGPGVPKEFEDTLFLPLISSKASQSGLGLSIAQDILFQHQGLIEHRPTPTGKTCFTITLPMEQNST